MGDEIQSELILEIFRTDLKWGCIGYFSNSRENRRNIDGFLCTENYFGMPRILFAKDLCALFFYKIRTIYGRRYFLKNSWDL